MIASAASSLCESYIADVLSGDVLTCQLVRSAVQRHVDDLQRQSTQGFPYHFDRNAASIAVDFFPLMLRHSIGDCAGLPFVLEPWQAFAISTIFGWKRDDDDSRRFRRVYWSMARKNGKSTIAAGIAYYMACLDCNPITRKPESVAQVVLSATKREQAEQVIYREIERMREQSQELKGACEVKNKQVRFRHNDGTIFCVGSDKPYDGLNPHCIIMDELHAWREHHRKFYDTMQTGSGQRRQPLIVTVTTAGDDKSRLWKEEYEYAAAVAKGESKDEQLFSFAFELDQKDDPLDESLWIKANPNLGVSVQVDYLRQMARPAQHSRLALNRFTRYHANRIVSSTEKVFDMVQWDACEGELSDWSQADAIGGGIDLGGRDDLGAWALVARFPVEGEETEDGDPVWRYEAKTQAYIASDSKRNLETEPFASWIYEGILVKDKYPIAKLLADFIAACEEFGINDVAYDPYNGQIVGETLGQEGITVASMAQNTAMFNEPVRELIQTVADGRFRHDGNPLLRWCAGNAVLIKAASNENCMFSKRDSTDKIDPLVAMTMAFRRAMVAKKKAEGSLYL